MARQSPSVRVRFIPTLTIGGTDYVDLLEQTMPDTGARFADADVPAAGQWVRVLLSSAAKSSELDDNALWQ